MEFNKVVPEPGPFIKSIVVKPARQSSKEPSVSIISDNESNSISLAENAEKKPDVKVFGIPVNKRETHVGRSDSFQSKFIRFLRADQYVEYETKWSKLMIACSAITGLLALLMFIIYMYYYFTTDNGFSSRYILDSSISEEIKEKNKSLNTFNKMSDVVSWMSILVGFVSLVASVKQWKTVFDRNSFRVSGI